MRDFYLRFDDEAAFAATGLVREPGVVELDVLGTLRTSEGEALAGWHVNLRIADGRATDWLGPWQVFPARPARVWT